jgi:hypothetical protein
MTINGPWRLVFRFKDGDAVDVEIVDIIEGARSWFSSKFTPAAS